MIRYAWARWGDLNAFFGLILDNVAVMIWLVVLVTSAQPVADQRFTREFVLTQMFPGTALGVLLGYLIWDYLRSSYRKMSTALTKNLVDEHEELK